ncbi:MucR family transcriptional regulator [Methylobacterium sp. WL64]|uniref:MucR family transcriptional regulator n=1 Tax=Methylobacterium sp. WL64 TaxID=2603894 RepID=UPI001FEE849C|nr:MucR family transcriptional regulator [Methylobacterium sp. WL64]
MEASAQGHASAPAVAEGLVEKPSAAEIWRSVGRDALISLENGKPYKTLRRDFTGRGLTPEHYREK